MAKRLLLILILISALAACSQKPAPVVSIEYPPLPSHVPPPSSTDAPKARELYQPPSSVKPIVKTPEVTQLQPLKSAVLALVKQAEKHQSSQDYNTASTYLERALSIQPDHPEIWFKMAQLRSVQTQDKEAIELAHKSLSLAPNQPLIQFKAWELIAQSHRQLGQLDEAEKALKQAMQIKLPTGETKVNSNVL